MQRSDLLAFLVSLGMTGLLIWGLVYFINTWWERLPKAVALTICILLAVMVIGYPIYALARWSDRYLARVKEQQKQGRQEDA
jgi:predicted transporter